MFNKIVIIGRLGFDPTSHTTKSGSEICALKVAVNTGYGDNKKTDWYNVSVFGKQAASCAQSLSKGSLVCATGSLQTREYETKDGQKRLSLELTADNVTFLDKKSERPQNTANDDFGSYICEDAPF